MYHRVAEGCVDPWSLCVTPQHFSQHLEVLREHYHPISLQGLVGSLDSGNLLRHSVVVTFDDGYADSLYAAKPLLEHQDIPATVFVTTGYIGEKHEFWWDELQRLLLQPGALPRTLWLRVEDRVHQWDLGEAAYYARDRWERDLSWRAPENPPSARHSVYVDLWRVLQLLPERERAKAMQDLRVWASEKSGPRSTHRLLTREEIVSLAQGGLVDVGSHTRTHPVLSELSPRSQREEVGLSKACLESILGRPITSLAYPYGSYQSETISIVHEAGFSCACSTVETAVREGCDRLQLPRVEIKDWDGEEFNRRLRAWFGD
jgi:peptidoglycan/xylan/chitin deacetylase (PgdA/CDA1 family)